MNRITVNAAAADTRISRHIYGHFSEHLGRCIYGGYWVGNGSSIPNVRGIRTDVVQALKKIRIPNLRWPGGCFADEYHWQDGIGPERPKMINTHWGGVTEDNSFGTHEFLDLCEQLSVPGGPRCEPYICGNVGSGAVQEMSQWVEYCNFEGVSPMADLRRKNGRDKPWNVRFWGVGNESWGCGGNMTPEYYADNYRRYAVYVRKYGDAVPYKIACGPNGDNYNWTRVLMEKTCNPRGNSLDGLALHYYTNPGEWSRKGSATLFNEAEWYITMRKAYHINELIEKHGLIMDEFDPEKKAALIVDEWGTWYDVEPGTNPGFLFQQNTLRDALVAAIHFNIFNSHAERVGMANIAQTINVLQSVIFTDGPKMILTPTYHAFDMFKAHQDALKLPVSSDCGSSSGRFPVPLISVSASEDAGRNIHISLTNIDAVNEQKVRLDIRGVTVKYRGGTIITSANMNDRNTFEENDNVTLKEFTGSVTSENGSFIFNLPSKSAVTLELA